MGRTQHAPRRGTILVGAVLTVFAAAALFLTVLPARVVGLEVETLGIYAAIAAAVVLLLGIFFEGI